MKTARLSTALAAACATLLLAACGGGGSEGSVDVDELDADTRALVEKAKEAGPVTFYSMIDEAALRTISEEFTQRYGVDVEPVRLVTADLAQRYAAEASSGRTVADLVLMTHSPFFAEALDKGWTTPFSELDIADEVGGLGADFVVDDGATPIVSLIPTDAVVNTDEAEGELSSWTDYADPANKGSLILAEPDSSPANAAFWSLMRTEYGDEFLEGVAANDPTWMSSAVPVSQAVAAGEATVGHPGVAAIVKTLRDSGAPVELVPLKPTTGPEAALAVSASSPNQAGAELLAQFLMSEEGNTLLNDETDALSPYDSDALTSFTRVADIEQSDPAEIRRLLGLD